MQDRRFAGRVRQQMNVDPHVHDAIVPTMILQPIVENAYAHGLSRLTSPGILSIHASSEGSILRLSVTNTGLGLRSAALRASNGSVSLTSRQASHALWRQPVLLDLRTRRQPRSGCDDAPSPLSGASNRANHRIRCVMIQAVLADDEVLARKSFASCCASFQRLTSLGKAQLRRRLSPWCAPPSPIFSSSMCACRHGRLRRYRRAQHR